MTILELYKSTAPTGPSRGFDDILKDFDLFDCFCFQWRPQAIVFGIVTNKKFDMIIMMFIGLNMLTMTLDHYGQSVMWNFALDNLNLGFICIFSTECILKMFALRQHYFTEPWNIFDFVVVILSILGQLHFFSLFLQKWFSHVKVRM